MSVNEKRTACDGMHVDMCAYKGTYVKAKVKSDERK